MQKRRYTWHLMICLLGVLFAMPAHAQDLDEKIAYDAWKVIHQFEVQEGIPRGLLHSMSLVETGLGMDGRYLPWPYTLNINQSEKYTFSDAESAVEKLKLLSNLGYERFNVTVDGHKADNLIVGRAKDWLTATKGKMLTLVARNISKRYPNKASALMAAKRLVNNGNRNFDIGLMQVNWYWHGKHFASLDEALDPYPNVAYAVSYLRKHHETMDWWDSVGRYHSGKQVYANKYVASVWDMYQRVHRLKPNG